MFALVCYHGKRRGRARAQRDEAIGRSDVHLADGDVENLKSPTMGNAPMMPWPATARPRLPSPRKTEPGAEKDGFKA
jgi:hypothetical protein